MELSYLSFYEYLKVTNYLDNLLKELNEPAIPNISYSKIDNDFLSLPLQFLYYFDAILPSSTQS